MTLMTLAYLSVVALVVIVVFYIYIAIGMAVRRKLLSDDEVARAPTTR